MSGQPALTEARDLRAERQVETPRTARGIARLERFGGVGRLLSGRGIAFTGLTARHLTTALFIGAGAWFLVPGAVGWAAAVAATVTTARFLRKLPTREAKNKHARFVADLPVAIDLMAACLKSGASWIEAVDATSEGLEGPLAEELRKVTTTIRRGADPAEAWQRVGTVPELAALSRSMARAARSGSAMTPSLTRLADDHRRTTRAAAAARAKSAGIKAVAPLGLCFLPAFFLVGIVPAIVGTAQTLPLP